MMRAETDQRRQNELMVQEQAPVGVRSKCRVPPSLQCPGQHQVVSRGSANRWGHPGRGKDGIEILWVDVGARHGAVNSYYVAVQNVDL